MKRWKRPILERLRQRRWNAELRRRSRRRARVVAQLPRGKVSPLISLLIRRMRGRNIAHYEWSKQNWVIKVPKVFSLTNNAEATLDVIYSVVQVARSKRRRLWFDHTDCVEIGLGASAVLDVVTMSLEEEWRASRQPYLIGGDHSRNEAVVNLVRCTGLTKHLNVPGQEAAPEVAARFTRTELHRGRRSSGTALQGSSDQERVASGLAKHLDGCFRKAAGYRLTRAGLREIVRWAGEVITNAEEHSGQNDWYAISYMAPTADTIPGGGEPLTVGECHLVVFCFGKSIFESLHDPNTPDDTKRQLSLLASDLAKRNVFGRSQRFSPRDLWTLYALQEGVSRFSPRPGKTSRGSGTVQMIDAFQTLGDSANPQYNPEMVVISGDTRIFFDNRYRLGPPSSGGNRMVIAFNSRNDLSERPDPKHVNTLAAFVPGTVLSLRFFIDRRHLEKIANPITMTEENH